MNIKQAQYIQTIANEGSITAAAKKLYISQPSLSQMVRQVEKELGVTLFDRTSLPLRLTYAGEKYLECAHAMIVANDRLENQLQDIRQENSGHLRLGISVQRGMRILPLAMPKFIARYPNVSLELRETHSATPLNSWGKRSCSTTSAKAELRNTLCPMGLRKYPTTPR